MSEVTQTITVGDGSGRQGNCLQAAVASALDLPLKDVPHFVEGNDWFRDMTTFVMVRGYEVSRRNASEEAPDLGLAFGQSPRGVFHAVVCRNGTEWDPHPSRDGLLSVDYYLDFRAVSP